MDTSRAVAVVGIGCRFPGVDNVQDYWKTLVNAENHISEIPEDRWNTSAFYSSDRNEPGKTYAKHAGTIHNVLDWDNKLFGVNIFEAEKMDPQQKLALEVTYMAFENGGFTMDTLSESRTCVFMGVMNADYAGLLSNDPAFADNYTATGMGNSILANRISYIFNLNGPSVTLDTACSSGSVAQHLGVQSILSGESDMAVCGGVTVILSPLNFIQLCKAQMASESGQCKTYSSEADGYVRSEGCGVLILKDLKKAREDGDMIWGVMTTVSNSDGKSTTPMTAPSSELQISLMESAVKQAQIEASQIDFVEMHGTGTPVGDPIECASVGKVMGMARKRNGLPPCPVGSVKTNIGHLEAAAGPAGIIKALLMMKHGQIVPSIIFGHLNKNLNLDALHLDVVVKVKDWPHNNTLRLVSVNSYGFGGSNFQAILQSETTDACDEQTDEQTDSTDSVAACHVVLYTGQDKKALTDSMNDTSRAIQLGQINSLEHLAYTSCYFRNLYPYRKAFTAKSLPDLKTKIESTESTVQSVKPVNKKHLSGRHVVMVFCGMGTHWDGMGLTMYASNAVFRHTIEELRSMFKAIGQIDILECLQGDKDLTNPLYGQPAIFAVQVALYNCWVDQRIVPDVIVGHSVGEVAASYASGHLSLEEAAKVIYSRACCVSKAKGGKMLVVGKLALEHVLSEMKPFTDKVEIAAYNSETSVTLTGDSDTILALEERFKSTHGNSIFVRALDVQVAYHSFYMDGILQDLSQMLGNVFIDTTNTNQVKTHISTVTGSMISASDIRTSDYWQRNVRQSVLFATAFRQTLSADKPNIVIEIGPRPALRANITEIGRDFDIDLLASMHVSNENLFNQSLEKCFELAAFKRPPNKAKPLCPFPRYAFQRSQTYKEPVAATNFRQGKVSVDNDAHPFVQKEEENLHESAIVRIEPTTTPFVFEHKLRGMVIVPGATYVEMGIACIKSHFDDFNDAIIETSVKFLKPGVITGNKYEMKVTLFHEPISTGLYSFHVTAKDVMHASGTIKRMQSHSASSNPMVNLLSLRQRMTEELLPNRLYEELAKRGFTYGTSVRCVESGVKNDTEGLVNLKVPPKTDLKHTTVHPVVLDTILQLSVVFADPIQDGQVMPFGIEKVYTYGTLKESMLLHLTVREASEYGFTMNACLMAEDGRLIVQCIGLTYGVMGKYSSFDPRETLFQIKWRETKLEKSENKLDGKGLIIISSTNTASMMAESLDVPLHNVSYKHVITEKLLNDHLTFKDILSTDLNTCGGIIYQPGLECKNLDEISGIELQRLVFDACFTLVQLIKYLSTTNFKIPIFLLTSGVYEFFQATNVLRKPSVSDLVGASLVAMGRTINKELPFLSFKSVDVAAFSKENMDLLQNVILANDDYAEVVICEGQYHVGAFHDSVAKFSHLQYPNFRSNTEAVDVVCCGGRYFTESTQLKTSSNNDYDRVKTQHAFLPHNLIVSGTPKTIPSDDRAHRLIASDFIVQLPDGSSASVYGIHNVATELDIKRSTAVGFDIFPCKIPCLSYWLNAYNTIKDLDQNLEYLLISLSNDAFQLSALKWVCKLQKIRFSESYDKNSAYSGVIITSNDTDSVLNQIDTLSLTNVSVLSTGKFNDATIFASPNIVRVVHSYQELVCERHLHSLDEFVRWLRCINKEKLKQALKVYCNFVERTTQFVRFEDLDTIHMDDLAPVRLSFESEYQETSVKCFSRTNVFTQNAVYVVIGGTKGLGWEIVKHIATRGAGIICIVSRSGVNDETTLQEIKDIEATLSCKIIDMKANVTDLNAIQRVFIELQRNYDAPIRGIFFGAVVTSDSLIHAMTREMFQIALAPKVAGVWNIYILSKHLDLDFFVIHSSVASLFGNAGQTNYGAGNAFEDAVACLRKYETGVGLSICWGALDSGILRDNEQAMKKVQAMGLVPLKSDEIIKCLEFGMGLVNESVISFVNFSWKRWSQWIMQGSNLLSKQYEPLLDRHCHYMHTSRNTSKSVEAATNEIDVARSIVKQLLFLETEDISVESTLVELGADSHQIQMFHSKLTTDFNVNPEEVSIFKISQTPLSQIFDMVAPDANKSFQTKSENSIPELNSSQNQSSQNPSDSTTDITQNLDSAKVASAASKSVQTKSESPIPDLKINPSQNQSSQNISESTTDSTQNLEAAKADVYPKAQATLPSIKERRRLSLSSNSDSGIEVLSLSEDKRITGGRDYDKTTPNSRPSDSSIPGIGSERYSSSIVVQNSTQNNKRLHRLKYRANATLQRGIIQQAFMTRNNPSLNRSSACVIL